MSMTNHQAEPKTARSSFGPPYICRQPWPTKCFVQCGGSGVVLSAKGNYRTAFFEAFPDTFIRGEGETIEEAEIKAWEKYQLQLSCANHDYQRRDDTEHGVCSGCSRFEMFVFRPVHRCAVCDLDEVNLTFYDAHLCFAHFRQLARDPEAHQHTFRTKPRPGLLGAKLETSYRESAWDADMLVEAHLLPPVIAEHQHYQYLYRNALGVDLAGGRDDYVRSIYQSWLEANPARPVGAIQFSVLSEQLLAREDAFKTATKAWLYDKALIPTAPLPESTLALRTEAFELFAQFSAEFALRQLGASHRSMTSTKKEPNRDRK